ncbi:MAG TPA: MraY family glycosyltransferase [Elusimicrobiota bacterium]|nr:MraY family glycosyltransferase [Elusimicrobiota bacterium]
MIESLYVGVFLIAFSVVIVLTPLMRKIALTLNIMDHPSSPVKTHKHPTPYLGGMAIFLGIVTALLTARFFTHFPTGTLRSLRGILTGATFVVAVGLLDDLKPGGLRFQWKFLFQFVAAFLLLLFDVRIKFIQPVWLADLLTVVWVVGVTNAFNIIDIKDGLAASQAFMASLGFLFISLPTEEIYVNFAAAAAAGAAVAFIPYNMSGRMKIFMGDTGSLMLGFCMAALSMGTSYTHVNEIGVFAPLLILGLPLYDTLFVSFLRIKQGKSPFLGSKDHLALKLEALGLTSRQLVAALATVAALFSTAAYCVTWWPLHISLFVFAVAIAIGVYVVMKLQKVVVP